MNYQRDSLAKFFLKQRVRQMAVVLSLFVLIMILGWAGLRLFGVISWWSRPLWLAGAVADTSLNVLAETGKTRRTLVSENRTLITENEKLKVQAIVHQTEQIKWQALESAWGRGGVYLQGIPALVISQPNRSPYDTLIVDVGSKNSSRPISTGMMVASDGVLLGRVTAVGSDTSQVRLFSAPGEQLNVLVGQRRVPAQAIGRGGGSFAISLPRAVGVIVGDTIVVPTTTPSLVGVVGVIDNNPNNPFQTILFRSPLNIFELPAVIIYDLAS